MSASPSTRERIIHAATSLYIVRGFHATSAQHIADQLGLTKPAIFYHFPSLDDLLRAIVMPFIEAVSQLHSSFPDELTSDEERERFLRAHAELYRAHLPAAQVMAFNQQIWVDPVFEGRPAATYRLQLKQLGGPDATPARLVRAHLCMQALLFNVARPVPAFADLDFEIDDFEDVVVRIAMQTLSLP